MTLEGEVEQVKQESVAAYAEAFAARPLTSNDIMNWQMKEGITQWDTMFALAFTSYRVLIQYMKEHGDTPIDEVREMLIRLYMVAPSHTWHFVPPDIVTMIDFLFNITDGDTEQGAERRKRCAALFAQMLGKARGTGYRWLRRTAEEDNQVGMQLKKLSSKLFSLSPDTARTTFWRAAFAMGHGRGFNMDKIADVLKENGVEL